MPAMQMCIRDRVKEMRKEVQSYREAAAGSSEQSDQALLDEIAHLQLAAGMTDVVGPGIEVVLEDSTAANISGDEADYLIHDSDILSVDVYKRQVQNGAAAPSF